MKPYDYHYYNQTKMNSLVAGGVSVFLLLTGTSTAISSRFISRHHPLLLYGSLLTLVASLPAKSALSIFEDTQRVLNDYDDISAQVRTNQVFYQMSKEPKVVQEYNWHILKATNGVISVIGSRKETLDLILALCGGRTVYVGNKEANLPVSQSIPVYPNGDDNLSLQEILDYKGKPTATCISRALEGYKGGISFILDHKVPLKSPQCQIFCTEDLGGIKVYHGKEATSRYQLPYSGYPCVVDGQMARWVY